jgi:hypothetical protein
VSVNPPWPADGCVPWNPKPTFRSAITQASLTGIGLLSLFLQKLGKAPNHQRSASLKLLEEPFGELGRIIPVLLLDEAQNYAMSALEDIRMHWTQPARAAGLRTDPGRRSILLSALRLRSHRALYSRIAAHARIESDSFSVSEQGSPSGIRP